MARKRTTLSKSVGAKLRASDTVNLAQIDPSSTPGFAGDKAEGTALLEREARQLAVLQEKLFANGQEGANKSVLLILQGMDTAGKGGITKHVVGTVGVQGVSYHAFKAPSPEELKHDFLWRIENALPGPGKIGVFDRSQYEDVLIHRVRKLSPAAEVERRYGAITDFEKAVSDAGTSIVKVMLHISPAEQKRRLKDRLERTDKQWKFNPQDIDERELWPQYQEAYQIALQRTTTEAAPWYVVPADKKWYARIAVQRLLIDALAGLGQNWPKPTYDVQEQLARLQAS